MCKHTSHSDSDSDFIGYFLCFFCMTIKYFKTREKEKKRGHSFFSIYFADISFGTVEDQRRIQ